jgi:hypothetical protein
MDLLQKLNLRETMAVFEAEVGMVSEYIQLENEFFSKSRLFCYLDPDRCYNGTSEM